MPSSTSDDPADCERFYTQRFLDRGSFLSGPPAVEHCEEVTRGDEPIHTPRKVTVTEIETGRGTATANVSFEGSTFDGQTVTLVLVVEDGDWKLDAKIGFVHLDRAKLIEGMRQEAETVPDTPVESQLGSCTVDHLEDLDDGALEEIAIGEDRVSLLRIGEACLKESKASRSL